MGSGNRSDFTKTTSVAPSPTIYLIPTSFDKNVTKNVGQTFGLSREVNIIG